jgi:diguanylate cyclase (GGDEF)-like protein
VKRSALLLLPGGVLLAAAAVVVAVPQSREWVRPLLPVATYAVCAAGLLLGLRFGNVRIVFGLVVVGLAQMALVRWPLPAVGEAADARAAVSVLLPLDLAALAWTSERGARWPRVKLWTAVTAAEALAVALLFLPGTAVPARALWHALLDPLRLSWATVSNPAGLVASALALVLTVGRFLLRPRPTESGLVWAVVAVLLALGASGEPLTVALYLATAALVLTVALVETSYALAYGDELTGLPSRRALNDLLGTVGASYAIGMVDIDHFKRFNDTYGHQAGDELLRKVATTLRDVSGGGRAFRYGGEEFAIVFPGLTAERAIPHLEALRKAIAGSHFTVRGPDRPRRKPKEARLGSRTTVGVTVSIGVADSERAGPAASDVVQAADEALYRAKRAGRNRLAS